MYRVRTFTAIATSYAAQPKPTTLPWRQLSALSFNIKRTTRGRRFQSTASSPTSATEAGNHSNGKRRRLQKNSNASLLPDDVPGLADFMRSSSELNGDGSLTGGGGEAVEFPPYLPKNSFNGDGKQV